MKIPLLRITTKESQRKRGYGPTNILWFCIEYSGFVIFLPVFAFARQIDKLAPIKNIFLDTLLSTTCKYLLFIVTL